MSKALSDERMGWTRSPKSVPGCELAISAAKAQSDPDSPPIIVANGAER
jgi:hypothetical protein